MLDPYTNLPTRKNKPKSTVKSDCATAMRIKRERLFSWVAGRTRRGARAEEFLLYNFGENVA